MSFREFLFLGLGMNIDATIDDITAGRTFLAILSFVVVLLSIWCLSATKPNKRLTPPQERSDVDLYPDNIGRL